MSAQWGLGRRIVLGVVAYLVLSSVAVVLHGYFVNEQAEHRVWESLLHAEFEQLAQRRREDPAFRWPDTETLEVFTQRAGLPEPLAQLAPGVHDEIVVRGRERVLLVRDLDGERVILALDIGDLEQRERSLGAATLGAMLALVVLLGAATAWGVGRLTRPLRELAQRIAGLQPQHGDERVALPAGASAELAVIADATNAYLERNQRFVERERAFVDTASHELRTPVAVIAGAAEIALRETPIDAAGRAQLVRIRQTARDVETLIDVLLVLARDPARLADVSERVALHELVRAIVEDHRHLCRGKALTVRADDLAPCEIVAPPDVVRVAIGNLVRNAIENSDRGDVVVALDATGIVRIDDPGHGMTPEEVAAIYARLARGGGHDGVGVGLALIGRVCEHLGWRLDFASSVGYGSRATLDLSRSLAPR